MEENIISSNKIRNYFKKINKQVDETFFLALEAKKQKKDPSTNIETSLTKDMTERVVKLVGKKIKLIDEKKIINRIKELEEIYSPLDWRVGFEIAKEIALNKITNFETTEKSVEAGIRIGFSYLTGGIVAAPLEGLLDVKIVRKNQNKHLKLIFAGPIRGAGGTASAVSVILSDYVRKELGLSKYRFNQKEKQRIITEVYDYHNKVSNLQYLPTKEEMDFILENVSVEISGESTSDEEVSNFEEIENIETKKIRGGMVLVISEGLCQKALKINKKLSSFNYKSLEDWKFLENFLVLQKEKQSKKETKNDKGKIEFKILPNYTYLNDLVGGRPVFGMPMKEGGFRLRLGKTRISGFSSVAVHPMTLFVLEEFLAYGTQIKIERPGKSATVTISDEIEPPVVQIKSGEIIKLSTKTKKERKITEDEISKILFLGDILISYGDFYESGQSLVALGYCDEWWVLEFEKKIERDLVLKEKLLKKFNENKINEIKKTNGSLLSFSEAEFISKQIEIPLHPKFLFFYNNMSIDEMFYLFDNLSEHLQKEVKNNEEQNITFFKNLETIKDAKLLEIFSKICIECKINEKNNKIIIDKEKNEGLFFLLNEFNSLKHNKNKIEELKKKFANIKPIEFISFFSSIKIKDKSGTFIGARMGRPEKSKPRKIKGDPNVLFPIEGFQKKNISENATINLRVSENFLEQIKEDNLYTDTIEDVTFETNNKNNKELFKNKENSNKKTIKINISKFFNNNEITKEQNLPVLGSQNFKGFSGVFEHILKGYFRSKYSLSVNKDGTLRYDMTECPIVFFKPIEIGITVEEAKKLGYNKDIKGEEIKDENQLIELFPQDIILPSSDNVSQIQADDFLLRAGDFIDDILINLYNLKKFYKYKNKQSTIGALVVVMAPHISCGTIARVIGYSRNQVILAHPLLHAAIRRDCDGDEASISLLLDVLINYSQEYLPNTRGAGTMDVPLLLSKNINPAEVDDQVHGYDKVKRYALELYEASEKNKKPWEIKIHQLKDVINTEKQFQEYYYTHDISNINSEVNVSAYKTIQSMEEKVKKQLKLNEKLVSVDENKVANMVLTKHFLKDIRRNFEKFFKQNFRCSNCGSIFSLPPLAGICTKCNIGKLTFTIHPTSVSKYVKISDYICQNYNILEYDKEYFEILKRNLDCVF